LSDHVLSDDVVQSIQRLRGRSISITHLY
jgi:hypothetical protein